MREILISLISGIASGAGMGGGTILIFLLTFVIGMEQRSAQAINLIFFIPTSIIAIIVNMKNKNIDTKLAIIVSIFGILGSIIGAKVAMKIDVRMLKKCFGIFLTIIAIHEIYTFIKLHRYKIKRHNKIKQN